MGNRSFNKPLESDAKQVILVQKSTIDRVGIHKARAFVVMLRQLGFSAGVCFVPSPLSGQFWLRGFWPIPMVFLMRILRAYVLSNRVLFYQESGFPFVILAKTLRRKSTFYLAGSPVGMLISCLHQPECRKTGRLRSWLGYYTTIFTLKAVDQIVTISNSCLDGTGIEPKKAVGPIPDDDLLKKTEFFAQQVPYDSRPKHILFVGRLEREKGAHMLPSIFRQVKENVKDVVLDVVGEGSLAMALREQAAEEGFRLHGYRDRESLINFYNNARLTLIPSLTEGMPSVAIESMLCGTPILATPVGWMKDFIKDGINGYIMDSLKPRRIADKIATIFNTDSSSVSYMANESIRHSPLMSAHSKWKVLLGKERSNHKFPESANNENEMLGECHAEHERGG